MLVYRDTARERPGQELAREFRLAVERIEREHSPDALLEPLLRAAELECALADLDGNRATRTRRAARVTDAIAAGVVTARQSPLAIPQLPPLPETVRLKTPEGYAFYALDPRGYAELAGTLPFQRASAGVIGIRSIGSSLSAIVTAALRQRGIRAERITVRPHGHPWARELELSTADRAWLRVLRARDAHFVIADEGPGMSGSTFASVARALEREGISPEAITLFCSHVPDPQRLTNADASAAFRRYASVAPPPRAAANGRELSAGAWRAHVFGDDPQTWPATWTQLERIKYLEDGWLDKFEGLPPYRQDALQRADTLAAAGYAPVPRPRDGGFVRYAWLEGRPATPRDLEPDGLRQLATYCAFRTRAFRATNADPQPLTAMLQHNTREAARVELSSEATLAIESPIIPDARMQPYEWRVGSDGRWHKLDGHGDGDGHLLPGPADVCWDLAGAIVEWEMNATQQAAFVHAFESLTSDSVTARLPNYLLAYTALRVGALRLAEFSAPIAEVSRLLTARARYGRKLERLLRQRGLSRS